MKLLKFFQRKRDLLAEKALSIVHSGATNQFFAFLPATNIDYATKVGDGLGSSVLAAPLDWLMRNFPQAELVVERRLKNEWRTVIDHPLKEKLDRPNAFYGGRELWMATVLDLAFGNAYWIKVRNKFGSVIEIWWAPASTMRPVWPSDGREFISHYEYHPSGILNRALGLDLTGMTVISRDGAPAMKLPPEDVVHFRYGLDPRNPRMGYSRLAALMREIYSDDEAANFASSILRNLGVIGLLISPKERNTATPEDVEAVKRYLQEHFTGDRRGQTLALGQPTEVQLLQYNMQAFDMSPLRDVSEERVCAAMGIPAAVVGFGTGLQATKVGATMREMRRMAWTDAVIPMQETVAMQLTHQLLPDFEKENLLPRTRVRFDTSSVPALMEDQGEKHERVRADYLAGLIKRSTAKQILGYPVEPEDEVYAQPMNVMILRPEEAAGNLPREGATNATTDAEG